MIGSTGIVVPSGAVSPSSLRSTTSVSSGMSSSSCDRAESASAATKLLPVNERSDLRLNSGEGLGLSLEYRFNERIGIEGGVDFAQLDSTFMFDLDEAWETDSDDISMLTFLAGLNIHLSPDAKVDFYIGPVLGFVDLGSATYHVLGETHSRSYEADDFAFGAQIGLDVPLGGGGWGLHFGAKYLDLSADVRDSEVDLNPFIGSFGFAYNF